MEEMRGCGFKWNQSLPSYRKTAEQNFSPQKRHNVEHRSDHRQASQLLHQKSGKWHDNGKTAIEHCLLLLRPL